MYKQICALESNENPTDTNDKLCSRELLKLVSSVASTIKYDFHIAEIHFIQQISQTGIYFLVYVIKKNVNYLLSKKVTIFYFVLNPYF